MKISTRELGLVWITAVAVLAGGAYWWADPRLLALREQQAAAEQVVRARQVAEHELGRREEYREALRDFRSQLPRHAANARVTADLLKMIEKTAAESGVVLLKREPEEERQLGDLFEVSINCTWEGTLEALVRFLYAIQSQGAILDVSFINVAPKPGQAEMLKGRFTVDCAYSREGITDQGQDTTENS
jgi:Tfp pilus assembly protein PilO